MERAVLFDCDGVLVDSENGLAKIAAVTLKKYYDIPAKPEDFLAFIGMGEDNYIGGVARKYNRTYTLDMKEKTYDEYIKTGKTYVEAMPGAKELVQKLRKEGFKVAMATSADMPKVIVNLEILGMTESDFDALITGNDVENKKPDPDIYLTAARHCGISPENCIVVEDAVSGVTAGKRAGMKVIGITSSLPADLLMETGADKIVTNMKELDGVIHEI